MTLIDALRELTEKEPNKYVAVRDNEDVEYVNDEVHGCICWFDYHGGRHPLHITKELFNQGHQWYVRKI